MKKFYYVDEYTDVYKESASKDLSHELESLGFVNKVPERGGGAGEIVNHIVANLSLQVTPGDITAGILSNFVWEILKTVFNWHRKNKLPNKKAHPSINIYIYTENKHTHVFSYKIDEEHSLKELREGI